MDLIIWFTAGAVAGYIAGEAVFEDEGIGVAGHVLLGALAGIVGGYLAAVVLGNRPSLDLAASSGLPLTIIGSVVVAAFIVLIVNEYTDRERLGV